MYEKYHCKKCGKIVFINTALNTIAHQLPECSEFERFAQETCKNKTPVIMNEETGEILSQKGGIT